MSKARIVLRAVLVCLLAVAVILWARWGRAGGVELKEVFAELAAEEDPAGEADTVSSTTQAESAVASPVPTEPSGRPEQTPAVLEPVAGGLDYQALDEFCAQQTGGFSVYIQDLESGQIYTYDGDIQYYPASTLKAAYALWLCERAEDGEIDFGKDLPNVFGAGGLADSALSDYDGAASLPVWEVIHGMIAYSDNDAVTLLASCWSAGEAHGFCDFLAAMGMSVPYSCTITVDDGIQGIMTVTDAGLMMDALYRYFETGSDIALRLQDCFLDAGHTALYVPEGVRAAKKYGSWDYAFHDLAIVYADHPYILCYMTDQGDQNIDFPATAVEHMQALGQMVYTQLNG